MNRVKDFLNMILKNIIFVLAAVVAGTVIMIAVQCLPASTIKKHVSESADVFRSEGSYKALFKRYLWITVLDNYTDATMLTECVAADENRGVAYNAMNAAYYLPTDIYKKPSDALVIYADGQNEYYQQEYARYWHGYKLFLRPLLLVFNYSGIRIINGIIAGLVTLAALWAVARRFGVKYLIAYMAAIICMSPWVIPFSMQNSSIYYIMNIGVIWLCLDSRITMESFRMPVVLLVMGIMTAFFDFLTYPVASLGVPLTICAIMMKNEKLTDELYVLFKCCVSWAMGYGLMWAGKWAAGSVILHRNVIDNAINQINYRSGNMYENVIMGYMINEKIFFFEKIENPFKTACVDYVLAIMGAIIAVSFILMIIYRNEHLKRKKNLLIFGFIALLPIAWYCVVANHTIVHWFFVFRGLVVFFFAMFAYCMTCFGKRNDAEMMQKERKI